MGKIFAAITIVICAHLWHATALEFIGMANGKSFFAVHEPKHWLAAASYCSEYGFRLAELKTAEQVTVINQYTLSNSSFWTGMRDAMDYSQLVWDSSGDRPTPEIFEYFFQTPNTPKNCGAVSRVAPTLLRVYMSDCWSTYPFYCETVSAKMVNDLDSEP